jgi:hypothetical protein
MAKLNLKSISVHKFIKIYPEDRIPLIKMKELSNNELLLYIYKEKDKVILTDL